MSHRAQMNKYSIMSSYWVLCLVSIRFCGKNTKHVHIETRNESKLTCNDSWCYKNSVWKRSPGHKKLVSSGAQRADRRGRQLKSSGMMNSNCFVDAAIFHRTGSAKVVADFPRWWNCNIFMRRHTRGSISNLLHDYYKECCAAVI